ncbi:MAG: hypothetical protein KAX31_01650, partial [Thermoplasmata archaeon]|nr:hypothetical protein [Thermoplasmata archaeon]
MVTGKTTVGLEGYLEKYLAASREYGFVPSDLRGVIRYLLSNGHIEINDKHIELMGNTDFYLDADHIPKEYRRLVDGSLELREDVDVHEKLIKAANEVERGDWTLDDDFEMEHKKLLSTKIEGVHIQNGRVNMVKIGETRIVEVYQTYDVPINTPLFDEIELTCPDCAGILEVLETPHPKGWTHLCKGDCGGYHAPYGKDYSNVPL